MNLVLSVLDINDNAPKFPVRVHKINISETLPVGSHVLLNKVLAVDTDSGMVIE